MTYRPPVSWLPRLQQIDLWPQKVTRFTLRSSQRASSRDDDQIRCPVHGRTRGSLPHVGAAVLVLILRGAPLALGGLLLMLFGGETKMDSFTAHSTTVAMTTHAGLAGARHAASPSSVDLGPLWLAWAIATVAVLAVGIAAGRSLRGSLGGILIDGRGRYSLARFHIVWWSAIILPLVAAVIVARFTAHGVGLLAFTIPAPVLALLGVSVVTTLAATGVKARKDDLRPDAVAGAVTGDAQWAQIVSVEEGEGADHTVDVGKVQSLVVTLLLGLGYVLTVIHEFSGNGMTTVTGPADLTSLPNLDTTFVVLLGVSSAAYVGSKTINRAGNPTNDLLAVRSSGAAMLREDAAAGLDISPPAVVRRRRAEKRRSRSATRNTSPSAQTKA